MSKPEALGVSGAGSVNTEKVPVPTQGRRRRRERGIPDLNEKARILCRDLINGTGDIGKRYTYTSVEQHREELRSRISDPLVEAMITYTEEALPTDIFLREDGITPHVFHSYRMVNLFIDYLDYLRIPKRDRPMWIATALGHDNTEDPQALLIEHGETEIGKQYGKTPAQSRIHYNRIMADLPKKVTDKVTDKVFSNIQLLNRFLPNGKKLSHEAYLERVIDNGLAIVKVADIESAYGDMRRIVREITESREGKRVLTEHDIDKRYERLGRSMDKVQNLLDVLGPHVPPQLRELMDVTIRAGRLFRGEVDKHFAKEDTASSEVIIVKFPGPRRGNQ